LEKDKDYLNNDRIKEMYDKLPGILNQAFHQVHEDLLRQKYDTQLSGTTCVAVLFDRNTIYCANAGDSRAVLYAFNKA
jgi:serine/threonine protein phosphatase PrpC